MTYFKLMQQTTYLKEGPTEEMEILGWNGNQWRGKEILNSIKWKWSQWRGKQRSTGLGRSM